ncbi:UDP-N-acetylmuramoyl-L-alanine--D-glutamate ligase [Paenibacillus koleovorans]|uniref:UDP-N-acetylmuramoyl-L-alanine--D-glutamate ligase n=1 Tax=Paenibacillus koleovorans TaxID=121608 RepID=UPI000FDC5900|nr:UDP-N-acetylmuramoyl-L-alanine--D-glutamate ligase [Paenibacillus koleovorans]
MNHPSQYAGKEVVVLGLARSGVAVAKLFHELGARVIVNDQKTRDLCPEAAPLEALGISVLCGGHPDTLIHRGVALLVKNPGIPYTIAPIQAALALGIEIVTEVEVANRISEAPMIGITGSNGKTTTTTWVGEMLSVAGLSPIIAGNIGRALCEAAEDATPDDWLVVELSSFQLKGTSRFRPRIACLLNISEAHLDYHGTMEDYITSKAKLFANQTEDDVAVLNADDPVCRSLLEGGTIRAKLRPFSMRERVPHGMYLEPPLAEGERLTEAHTIVCDGESFGCGEGVVSIIPALALGIPGQHNVEDALAAAAMALCAGASVDAVAEALRSFRGVEHRLEYVGDKNGISFYNNSKATNSLATIKALESFDRPVVLIAGGKERGSEYTDLLPYMRERVKAVVTLGETRDKIADVAVQAGIASVKSVDTANSAADTLRTAVEQAYGFASPGDVVLLSPACASWDMFTSFEVRGSIFKQSVHNL